MALRSILDGSVFLAIDVGLFPSISVLLVIDLGLGSKVAVLLTGVGVSSSEEDDRWRCKPGNFPAKLFGITSMLPKIDTPPGGT